MTLIGFHFKKMMSEKTKAVTGQVNAKTNITVTNIKQAKLNMGNSKQAGAEISFQFTVEYDPSIGKTVLDGALVYMGSEEIVKKTIQEWEKDKKLGKDVVEEVYNHILFKCNIEALILAKDMQLPAHIQLPRVKAN